MRTRGRDKSRETEDYQISHWCKRMKTTWRNQEKAKGKFAQCAWFFIAYTLLNAVFFTANNIAYAALVALVTKNNKERVEMGSWRFIFAFSTVLVIQSVTVKFVQILGGGAYAWKVVAIVFAIVGVIVNTISGKNVTAKNLLTKKKQLHIIKKNRDTMIKSHT